MPMRLAIAISLVLTAAAAVLPLRAAAPPAAVDNRVVDLQLVLAVDISGSMEFREQEVQRDGYVRAFRDPEVLRAITSGPYGRIAVTYVRWAGIFSQETAVPWTIIGSKAEADGFADAIRRVPLYTAPRTSISGALNYSFSAFTQSGVDSDRRTIDISGDGSNNDGPPVALIRQRIIQAGVTINGLPILINPSGVGGNLVSLDAYYQDCVIGGPGSFMIPVKANQDFAPAIRRKLILEIAAAPALVAPDPAIPVSNLLPVPRVNCAVVDGANTDFFP
jgi:hypothetical protein